MIKKWRNTYAETAAEMLNVTDRDVLNWSNGEINRISDDETLPHSLEDQQIFGKFSDQDLSMGHIVLPFAVINVQYLCGRRPVLAGILGLEQGIVEKIVHYIDYININPQNVAYKKVISYNDYCKLEDSSDYKTGAEAIEILLGDHELKNHIILHNLPVIPVCMRYMQDKENPDIWHPMHINYMYVRIINRIQRLHKLMKLHAPLIILLNESRMLQEYVNCLIDNGAYGYPVLMDDGAPADSLSTLYEYISKPIHKTHYTVPEGYISNPDALKIAKEYQEFEKNIEESETNNWEKEEKERNEILDRFMECITPFFRKMMHTYFAGYIEYETAFLSVCRYFYDFVLTDLDLENEIGEQTCEGLGKVMENFAKKRVKFLK